MKEYNIAKLMVQDGVEKAIKHYGLEGADEAIKRVYSRHPKIKQVMLDELWKKIRK